MLRILQCSTKVPNNLTLSDISQLDKVTYNKAMIAGMKKTYSVWTSFTLFLIFGFSLVSHLGCAIETKTSVPAIISRSCHHDATTLRCAKVTKIYDGDTITVEIPNLPPIFGHKLGVRINGIDTPEKRPRKAGRTAKGLKCEKAKALEARQIVVDLLGEDVTIDLKNVKRGKFFRVVADVYTEDGKSIADELIKAGYAYEYHGKTKRNINWCYPLDAQPK